MTARTTTTTEGRDLVLTSIIDGTREAIFRAWTEPTLMEQWFCPKPWTVTDVEIDLRPGGTSAMIMRGPEGQAFPNRGVYLEVRKNERLVWTDAFTGAWQPAERAFMVGDIRMEDAGPGQVKYTARIHHWTEAAREEHEKMGFHEGWKICTDQLAALVEKL